MAKIIFLFQLTYSLYIILNPQWAVQMNGKIRNNEVFVCRQTVDSIWVTSYSSFLDTNFTPDWNWYLNNGFLIDTITLSQQDFNIPKITN